MAMSEPLVVTIPHQLGREEARRRIDESLGKLVREIGAVGEAQRQWDGDVLRFSVRVMGQAISGLAKVADAEVRLEVLLPGLLGMLAGKVRGRLQKEGQVLLEDRSKR